MKNKIYHTVRTVPTFDLKNTDTEEKFNDVGLDHKASLMNLPQCSGDMVQQRHHNNDFEGPRHSVKRKSLAPLNWFIPTLFIEMFYQDGKKSGIGVQVVSIFPISTIFITCGCESSAPFFVIYKAGREPTPYW
jgi:hypothetical protein